MPFDFRNYRHADPPPFFREELQRCNDAGIAVSYWSDPGIFQCNWRFKKGDREDRFSITHRARLADPTMFWERLTEAMVSFRNKIEREAANVTVGVALEDSQPQPDGTHRVHVAVDPAEPGGDWSATAILAAADRFKAVQAEHHLNLASLFLQCGFALIPSDDLKPDQMIVSREVYEASREIAG